MVMKKASGDDSPLRQGAGKSFWTLPILGRRQWRLAVCFMEKVFVPLGFSHRREFIGGRAMSGDGPGAHTTWWRGQGWLAPPYGAAASWSGSVSPLDPVFPSGK
jgi:hypothetical protein